MGLNTTITFRNDAIDQFQKHPLELTQGIIDALQGKQLDEGDDYFAVGNHGNPVILQRPIHASIPELYLHYGNTVTGCKDVNERTHESIRDAFIKQMERELERLKSYIK